MDGILDQCQKLSPAVDELALKLYPPMIFSDIQTKREIYIDSKKIEEDQKGLTSTKG